MPRRFRARFGEPPLPRLIRVQIKKNPDSGRQIRLLRFCANPQKKQTMKYTPMALISKSLYRPHQMHPLRTQCVSNNSEYDSNHGMVLMNLPLPKYKPRGVSAGGVRHQSGILIIWLPPTTKIRDSTWYPPTQGHNPQRRQPRPTQGRSPPQRHP